jgi:hypothetical protein
MKPIAFYLPQFYSFPENDKWWGKGFTEWTNVRKSKPLFKGHYQPTIPLNENFYSLENIETMKWQVELAKKYGIYGFCFYHYWFGENRQLMEKPVDAFLEHKEIDFPYCLSWANHNWSRTWVGGDKDILMDMRYGGREEWEKHFQYLLPFFKDPRYIKINDKPAFVIYMPGDVPELDQMMAYFQSRAMQVGLNGITIIAQNEPLQDEKLNDVIDYFIEYQPNYAMTLYKTNPQKVYLESFPFASNMFLYKLKMYLRRRLHLKQNATPLSYDAIWNYILNHTPKSAKTVAGAFVRCDVSPRRQERALIFTGDTPEKFEKYMKLLNKKIQKEYSTDYLFISAWNEWGEGMYLEPDEKHKYGYLEAIKESLL